MDTPFAFSVPTAVRFGWGVSGEIAAALPTGTTRVALLHGRSGQAAASVRRALEAAGVVTCDRICVGEPSVPGVNALVADLSSEEVGAIVAVGGGSVMDAGKAVAFCLGHRVTLGADFSEIPSAFLASPGVLPCIAVPTTAGTGAEVTANAVLDVPERRAKVSLRGRALFPAAAFVDPGLLRAAPTSVLLSSGLDAVVQTIEACTSCAATPFSDALARPNVALGLTALKAVMSDAPPDHAWRDLAWVSLTSGVALANGGLGAAHGIASIIGGRHGAPHGALCGRLLTPVMRKNHARAARGSDAALRVQTCITEIAAAFPSAPGHDGLAGLEAWQDSHALPRLREFGVRADDLAPIAEAAAEASSSKKNAVPLTSEDLHDILREAL